jgi:hypothetical protein
MSKCDHLLKVANHRPETVLLLKLQVLQKRTKKEKLNNFLRKKGDRVDLPLNKEPYGTIQCRWHIKTRLVLDPRLQVLPIRRRLAAGTMSRTHEMKDKVTNR